MLGSPSKHQEFIHPVNEIRVKTSLEETQQHLFSAQDQIPDLS